MDNVVLNSLSISLKPSVADPCHLVWFWIPVQDITKSGFTTIAQNKHIGIEGTRSMRFVAKLLGWLTKRYLTKYKKHETMIV